MKFHNRTDIIVCMQHQNDPFVKYNLNISLNTNTNWYHIWLKIYIISNQLTSAQSILTTEVSLSHIIQRPAVPFCTIISCKEFWLKILWSIRFRLHTLFLLGGDTFVLTCLAYIQQTCRDENIPRSMPNEGIIPEFFYFGEIVLQYNSMLLNWSYFLTSLAAL